MCVSLCVLCAFLLGMLLHGPPGTGKTLIARKIGEMLDGHKPKIVNGPEVLSRWVGVAEEKIRALFEDAEKEYKEKKDKSGLHIIIFDEIDAICRVRGSDRGSGGLGDTIVNQLLTKLDGVETINNILVIGMTNRKDMIDPALLRPGRLEVHLEISLPNETGRKQILGIHTRKMRDSGMLGADVDLERLASLTKNFSGAEIEAVAKHAAYSVLYSKVDKKNLKATMAKAQHELKITMADFLHALDDIDPAFGVAEADLQSCLPLGFLQWDKADDGKEQVEAAAVSAPLHEDDGSGSEQDEPSEPRELAEAMEKLQQWVKQVQTSSRTPLLTVLMSGEIGAGKTAISAKIAKESGFPFVRRIAPEQFVDVSEDGKRSEIAAVFRDAYRSELSLIILDDVDRLLQYSPAGPHRYQPLLSLLKQVPPKPSHRLMVLATTSDKTALQEVRVAQAFKFHLELPLLTETRHIAHVLTALLPAGHFANENRQEYAQTLAGVSVRPIAIRPLIESVELMRSRYPLASVLGFGRCQRDAGLRG